MDLLPLALAGLAVLVLTTLWSRRTGIAAPLLLVALGLLFSVLPSVPTIELEPEWILAGVLPPLLYSSSVRLPVVDLRRNFGVICWLSIVVVVAGAVLIGGIVHWLVQAISLLSFAVPFIAFTPAEHLGASGVVTLAAAQTITAGEAVVLIAFAVAVGSLAILGGTLPWLIRRMSFEEPSAEDRSAEFHRLMSQLVDSAAASVGSVRDVEVDGEPIDDSVVEAVIGRLKPMLRGVSEADAASRASTREQAAVVLRRYLLAMREALVAEQSIGAYSTAALTRAEKLLDRQEHWSG